MTASLTHYSHTTHGVLTESSVTAPTRKGREGKGSGIGGEGRVETPIHSSGSVTRETRIGWMGETQ